jgi:hypothetical protein
MEHNFDESFRQILGMESDILWESEITPTLETGIDAGQETSDAYKSCSSSAIFFAVAFELSYHQIGCWSSLGMKILKSQIPPTPRDITSCFPHPVSLNWPCLSVQVTTNFLNTIYRANWRKQGV